jgi:hypothetical protein
MQEDWLQREIRTFASAVAGRLRKGDAPSIEIPIAPLPTEQDPPPDESKAVAEPARSRRAARRQRKRNKR